MKIWSKCLNMVIIILVMILIFLSYQDVISVFAPNESQSGFRIEAIHYEEDGTDAYYPQFVSGMEQENVWNQMILDDFNKILAIYSFRPFPENVPTPTGMAAIFLTIKNEVKAVNQNYFSTFYTADYSSPFSAHPSELVYTTNLDLKNNKRLRLSDIIQINGNFIEFFRTWKPIISEPGNEEIDKAVKDYLAGFSDEDLLKGFRSADVIGSVNSLGIYSYLTPDRLGISISVPNYIGDHVEFEKEYTQIKDYLNPSFLPVIGVYKDTPE